MQNTIGKVSYTYYNQEEVETNKVTKNNKLDSATLLSIFRVKASKIFTQAELEAGIVRSIETKIKEDVFNTLEELTTYIKYTYVSDTNISVELASRLIKLVETLEIVK